MSASHYERALCNALLPLALNTSSGPPCWAAGTAGWGPKPREDLCVNNVANATKLSIVANCELFKGIGSFGTISVLNTNNNAQFTHSEYDVYGVQT